MKQTPSSLLDRRISLQRLAMTWERLWTAIQQPLIVVGLAIILVASGTLQALPSIATYLVMMLLVAAFVWSLRDVRNWQFPTERAAMRRMETAAAVAHRSLSGKDDVVASELTDPDTQSLWVEHQRRQREKMNGIAVSPPRSSWRDFDATAARVPIALGVIASLALGSGTFRSAVSGPGIASLAAPVETLSIDAWLKPPAYTGKPPVLLTSAAMRTTLAGGADVLVPENAALSVRVTGADNPRIEFHALGGGVTDASLLPDIAVKSALTPAGFTVEAKLERPVIVRLLDGTTELAAWPISLIPDQPPVVAFSKSFKVETGGALTLNWEASDDYGVRAIASEVELADEQDDGVGFAGDGPFLFEAPKFPVTLKKSNARSESGKNTHDLTAHPWAGLNVIVTLKSRDAAGQFSDPATLSLKLPERVFTRPMAKALIEQRKQLILTPDHATEAAALLDAILLYPTGVLDGSGHHIRLASITSALENSATTDDIKAIIGDLWQLALDIEDGSLADAKAELSALKKQLEDAIRNGASEEEIAKLMDKMRDAMNRYMDAMRKESEKRDQQAGKQPRQNQGGDQKMVTREDLQRMMDMIEKLTKEGKQDQAQALLDELDRMLQNMQPGQNQQAQGEGNPMGEMLDQLQEMMREQQRLMDDTQRMQPGDQQGEGQMGENGQQPGQQPGQSPGRGNAPGQLSDRQGSLGDMLDRMMRELGGNAPGELGEAGREMRGAQGSLGQSDKESALQQQGDALEQLRKGAGEMRRQMREGQGQARNNGRDGEAAGGNDDPLGRPRASRNQDMGPDEDMLPTEQAQRRAREIIKQLRDRAGEQGLTDTERSYIDRLLRGLY